MCISIVIFLINRDRKVDVFVEWPKYGFVLILIDHIIVSKCSAVNSISSLLLWLLTQMLMQILGCGKLVILSKQKSSPHISPAKWRNNLNWSLHWEDTSLFCEKTIILLFILHLVILQMLLSKATCNWGIHKAIHLEEANRQMNCS